MLHLLTNIGQRYQVIVTAKPKSKSPDCVKDATNCNYWIRTRIATGCGTVAQDDETTGIIQYSPNRPARTVPTTTPNTQRSTCVDEPIASLQPVFHWVSIPMSIYLGLRHPLILTPFAM